MEAWITPNPVRTLNRGASWASLDYQDFGEGETTLVLEAKEKDVGPLRADILYGESRTDQWVLIENQLE